MSRLLMCDRCNGFLAAAMRACPHCDARLGPTRATIIGIVGGGITAATLMACYGAAPSPHAVDAGPDAASVDAQLEADSALDGDAHDAPSID